MKKILALILCVCLVFALSACGSDSNEADANSNSNSVLQPVSSENEVTKEPEINPSCQYTVYPVKVWASSIGTPWAQVIIEVLNDGNCNLYLNSISVDFENASGALFATQSYINAYPQIIAPGETAYYYEEVMLDNAPSSDLTALPHLDIEAATVEKIQFPISDLSVSADAYGYIKAIGRVENTTAEEQNLVKVAVMFYDENNEIIGIAFTYVDIAAGDKVGFEVSGLSLPSDVTIDRIASYTAVAYPEQYQFNFG